jgi:glycine cleavage system H lipoate-binding protein
MRKFPTRSGTGGRKKSGNRMTCPFLKEARVKYCRTSSIRKLIPLAQRGSAEDRCSSEKYPDCPVFRQQADGGELAAFGGCPFLDESLMQYCGAASVVKFIPYSESLLSRCGNDGYRYCELYLQMAHPPKPPETADGIPMPAELGYSANHMWVDTGDGICHVGIDALLARTLGPVERISLVSQKGHRHPVAIVTCGVDLEIALPFPLEVSDCNLYLRANPAQLTADPYHKGWLFAGVPDAGALDGLRRGAEAQHWMEAEVREIHEFLQQLPGPSGKTAADGGMFSAGLTRYLEREQIFALFHQFFSPFREQGTRP